MTAKSIAWWIMTSLALFVALFAISQMFTSSFQSPVIAKILERQPIAGYGHFLASGFSLAIGAFQFNSGWRKSWPSWHRWLGRCYIVFVAVGAVCSFQLALNASGGLVAKTGFAMLGVVWVISTFMAYKHIRAGDIQTHQIWMIRSYALTFGAVTLRLYIPASLISGLSFEDAYPAIAWVAWVPNLIVAEWIIIPLFHPRRSQHSKHPPS